MNSILCLLTTENLTQLAGAIRAGRISAPFSSLALRSFVPASMATSVAEELQKRSDNGFGPQNLADLVEILSQDRGQRPHADDLIDLVWTGPEAPGITNRDTSVVVREMFQNARECVLIAGYAVYQGQTIFRELAECMDENSDLRVQMFLDIQRPHQDRSSPSSLVRSFANRFVKKEWPGRRLPTLYYDPRSLEINHAKRASLHAKCVVVDRKTALVSSANFTEAAQTRNIELGLCINSEFVSTRIVHHFESLVQSRLVSPVPLTRSASEGTERASQ